MKNNREMGDIDNALSIFKDIPMDKLEIAAVTIMNESMCD